jgi:hypothetical protein
MSPSLSSSKRSVPLAIETLEDRCVLSASEYVGALYTTLLHRSGQPAEVAGWEAALDAGVSPGQIARQFATSPEYRTNLIETDYQTFLGRQAGPTEVAGWLGALQSGLTEQQLAAGFLASPEFFAANGNNTATWLNAVYQAVLGRPAGAPEQAAVAGIRGFQSLEAVALAVAASPEADARAVTAAFQDLLGRGPDAGGLAYWTSAVVRGLQPAQLRAQLASSAEFITLWDHGNLNGVNSSGGVPSSDPGSVSDGGGWDQPIIMPPVDQPPVSDPGPVVTGGDTSGLPDGSDPGITSDPDTSDNGDSGTPSDPSNLDDCGC